MFNETMHDTLHYCGQHSKVRINITAWSVHITRGLHPRNRLVSASLDG